MDKNQEYNNRMKYRTEEELNKAKKYHCDGLCYGRGFMCPRVDYCDETRVREGTATIIASIFFILMSIITNPITWIIIILLEILKK